MKPRFSVVIPAYNAAAFIDKTLDRVFKQEYPAHEIIVIDDGSTDATPEVLKSYGDRIVHKRVPNGGPARARNIGNGMATGDYLAFLDNDDLWFVNRLKKQAEFIQRFPEIGLFACNYAVRYPYLGYRMAKHYSLLKNKKKMVYNAPLGGDPFALLLRENFVGTPSAAVVRRDIAGRVGAFIEENWYAYDYDYWLRCSMHTNIVVMDEVLLYKKTMPHSMSNEIVDMWFYSKRMLERLCEAEGGYIRAHGLIPLCRDAMARFLYQMGDACFEKGQHRKAFGAYIEALKTDPAPRNLLRFGTVTAKKTVRLFGRAFNGGRRTADGARNGT